MAARARLRLLRAGLPALAVRMLAVLLLLATGCERRQDHPSPPPPSQAAAPATAAKGSFAASAREAQERVPVLLVLGDSLAAAHGLPAEEGFVALLEARMQAAGLPWRVVNAGVSGDTSAGGLARMDWLLKQRIDVLLLELGGNDGLRGQSPDALRDNLAQIIARAQAHGITVVLAGMQMPDNFGPDYTRRFKAAYPALAKRYGVALVPFLLEGVAMHPELNQPDGIHPTAEGARIVADNVWPVLEPVLRRESKARGGLP
jgi:acyl-CoA thioesterase I